MKNFKYILLCLLLLPSVVFAREMNMKEFTFSAGEEEYFYNVTETLDGGYVAVGSNFHEEFIVKYDKEDKVEWKKESLHELYDVEFHNNYIYVLGNTFESLNNQPNSGGADVYLGVYTLDGKLYKEFLYGGEGYEFVNDLEIVDDYFYIAGFHNSNGSFDNSDAFLMKINKDFEFVTGQAYGGNKEDSFYDLTVDSEGNIYAVGYTYSTDLKDVPVNAVGINSIIVKFDKSFNNKWVKTYDINEKINPSNFCEWNVFSFYSDVNIDCDGNIIVTGSVPEYRTVKGENSQPSLGPLNYLGGIASLDQSYEDDTIREFTSNKAVVIKYDKDGKLLWEYEEDTDFDDAFYDLEVTDTCNYLIAGAIGDESYLVRPHVLTSGRDEALGWSDNTCIRSGFDGVIRLLDNKGKKTWGVEYDGNLDESLQSVELISSDTFVSLGYASTMNDSRFKVSEMTDGFVVRVNVTYDITVEDSKNGSAVATNQHGKADVVYHGDIATITTSPDDGYKVDTIKVVDSTGKEVKVEKNDDGTYSYHIYDDTWVTVTFKNIEVVDAPKTGIEDYLVLAGILIFIACVVYYSVNKNFVFKKM